jgi:hypothetical protein
MGGVVRELQTKSTHHFFLCPLFGQIQSRVMVREIERPDLENERLLNGRFPHGSGRSYLRVGKVGNSGLQPEGELDSLSNSAPDHAIDRFL